MKKIILLVFICLINLNLWAQKKTVMDYWKILIKEDFIKWKEIYPEQELNSLYAFETQDLTNGYLKYNAKMNEGWSEMVLWNNRSNGKALVAIAQYHCGPLCTQEVDFYEFTNETYRKIQEKDVLSKQAITEIMTESQKAKQKLSQILEPNSGLGIWMVLPRKGLDINILVCPVNEGNFDSTQEGKAYITLGTLKYNGLGFDFAKKK